MTEDKPVAKRPIYTVPRDSEEYKKRREAQFRRGLRTFLQALVLFGGAIALYFIFRN